MKQFFVVVAVVLVATTPAMPQNVDIVPRMEVLPEVVVLPIDTETKHFGRRSNRGPMVIKVEGDSAAGKEVALSFRTKKRAWIKRVSFAIEENDSMLISMPFRLNLYKKQGNEYANNFVSSTEFLYTKEAIVDERFTFTFPTPWAIDKGEYVVAIEFLENFPGQNFIMPTNVMTGHTYLRSTSQPQWQKIPLGSTLAIEVAVEK